MEFSDSLVESQEFVKTNTKNKKHLRRNLICLLNLRNRPFLKLVYFLKQLFYSDFEKLQGLKMDDKKI
ncbi:Uncharacterised protein [Mycoplasmopsis fermentans]|nr:Uncharacterised protein [Mycoplasmopsis fermentans]